jgi:phage I-like protein
MSRYLVTEPDGTGHLPVRDSDHGPLNHHLMGAAWAALHSGYRANKYEGPGKESAIAKLKALYKSEGLRLPSEASSESGVASGERTRFAIRDSQFAWLLAGLGKPIEITGKATHEIPICVTGTWVKNDHKFSITAEDLASMVSNFDKRKNSQVVIDYEHASEQPDVAKGGPIPAAGWIHSLRMANGESRIAKGSDLFATPDSLLATVEWTPEAAKLISGGQYRFFSPAIDWNFPDKETGHSQGATLTSGALTNHPFLEELPPITLTEAGVLLADVSTGYLDAPVKSISFAYPGSGSADPAVGSAAVKSKTADAKTASALRNGGKMASKKLSICKMGDGPDVHDGAKGHHGIFDDKDYVGHVTASDMKDHVKACMSDGFGDLDEIDGDGLGADAPEDRGQAGIKGHQTASELLAESGVRSPESGVSPEEQIKAALKLAATHRLVEAREASRNQLLSLVTGHSSFAKDQGQGTSDRTGWFAVEKAKTLLRDDQISAADLLDAIEAKGMLDEAVAKGKVLPKDRAFFFEIAFNSPAKFSEYIAGAVPVVALASVGLGSTENIPVDKEVDMETKKLMSEKKIGYGKAMKEVFKANPQLEERYRAAHQAQPKDNTDLPDRSAGITQ